MMTPEQSTSEERPTICGVPWPGTVTEARACQERCRSQVKLCPLPGPVTLVAGVDAAYARHGGRVYGAVVVMSIPDLKVVEKAGAANSLNFPYIPGLLTFREAPVLMRAVRQLRCRPDVILVDGQGIAHPRGLGLASHLGLLLETPTIGVAKSRLWGDPVEPAPQSGAVAPLLWQGRQLGWIWRSRSHCRPLFISPGHLVTLEEVLPVVTSGTGKYRLPLPLRAAHVFSQELRRETRNVF